MIGEGRNRVEGPLKVAGLAPYSAERSEAGEPLHGFVLGAAIGKGRITSLDASRAEASPGVRLVLSYKNRPDQSPFNADKTDLNDPHPEFVDTEIRRYGQPVAFVVADTFEEARAAAQLIDVTYESAQGAYDLALAAPRTEWRDDWRLGDVDRAMLDSPVVVDATYSTPYHWSHPMELNASIADWRDGHLTLYLTAQILGDLQKGLSRTLKLQQEQVTVDSAYVGGGFGSKIALHAEAVLSSLATRILGRPVKLIMTRRQLFTLVGHRPASISHIRLAATRDGKFTAIGHDAWIQVTETERWNESVWSVGRPLYAAPNKLMRQAQVELDLGAGEPVRGPGEVPGLMTFESAVDELAHALDMDPLELRLKNDIAIDPAKNVPLSSRRLADCLRDGAVRFGWSDRPTRPASRRDGDWLVGYGVASSIRGHFQTKVEAKVRIEPDGRVIVMTDMTDLGTGTYTITAQIAAAALGVPFEAVTVKLARTDLPKGMGSAGSWGAANTSVSTDRACQALREKVEAVAGQGYNDILAAVRRHFPEGVEATGATVGMRDDPNYDSYSQHTYGATFAEVGVDAYTAEVRVRRMTGVFACGRIINEKTARSQLTGGMIWGVSAALHEAGHVDTRNGAWVNGDLAEYLMPVHADIPDIEAIMLDDFDEHANHLGIKGIGELGSGGTAASVANAVFNATGVRVRDFPITLDKLLPGMPRV